MLIFKAVLYCATFAAGLFFAFWESKLRRELTDDALRNYETSRSYKSIDTGFLSNISDEYKREEILNSLPHEARSKMRRIAGLKFIFVAILVVEILLLQRS